MNTTVKKGKKPKVTIPEEDLTSLDQGSITPKDLADKHNVTPNTIYQIKHKRKLKMQSMELVEPDPLIQASNLDQVKQVTPNEIAPASISQNLPQKQYDYDILVSGLWSALDSVCVVISVMSRGKMEYKKLTKDEIETLTNGTKQNTWIQKLSTMDQMNNIVMFGTIAVVFRGRFTFKKDEKHNNKDPQNCKCRKCLEDQRKQEEISRGERCELCNRSFLGVELLEEHLLKDHKDVIEKKFVETSEKTQDLNNIIDTVNNMTLTDTTGAIPTVNNVSDTKTEQEVLDQNRVQSEGEKNLGKVFKW